MSEGEPKFEEEIVKKPTRKSGISRVVGADIIQEREIQEQFQDTFQKQSDVEVSGELLKNYEREKTEEEQKIIQYILDKIPEFIEIYGGEPIAITSEHVHILDNQKLDQEAKIKLGITRGGGGYNWPGQTIYLLDTFRSKLEIAQKVAHEIIHFNSFQSIEITEKNKRKINMRRIGFEVGNKIKKEIYFTQINEAITEELVKRFDKKYFQEKDILKEELKQREGFKKSGARNPEDISNLSVKEIEPGRYEVTGYRYAYDQEREKFSEIIKEIYEANKEEEEFSSFEDVFAIFAQAALTGRLLRVADLYERTYGKGSFRALGEETKKK